ncbi:guanylate kinase [Gilliamella apis]|uniref:guanylate kinase n=1 Tax=Gilliamella apis TaxID=1970738 RepID=UPI000A355692|nr:guanylate kinase [Gilliamella apis]OTQ55927.1 guanylate kinase [Gilliamella apis]
MYTGTLFIISAPSGAGKSSLIRAYLAQKKHHPAKVSISHTTRKPRPGEQQGEHYYFVDNQEFESLIKQNAFVEYAHVFDHYYGTSKAEIEQSLLQGINVFLDIDWQGAEQVRQQMPESKSIFILPPSLKELENRLIKRGQDDAQVISKRMHKAQSEISHYNEYDYVIINDDFDESLTALNAIMTSASLEQSKQAIAHHQLLTDLLAAKY